LISNIVFALDSPRMLQLKKILYIQLSTTRQLQLIENMILEEIVGFVSHTTTIHGLLYFKSKFPNHFASTLGRFLFLQFLIQIRDERSQWMVFLHETTS